MNIHLMLFPCAVLAEDAAAPAAPPSTAKVVCIFNPNDETKTVDDLRLKLLEKTQGITWWLWNYEIPAGQKLIIHFTTERPTQDPPVKNGVTFEITGPLGKTFKNRISLLKSMTPVPGGTAQVEQYWVEASSEKQTRSNDSLGATVQQLEEGGQGWAVSPACELSSGQEPAILFAAQRIPKDKEVTFKCSLEVSVAPADPNKKPGDVVQK